MNTSTPCRRRRKETLKTIPADLYDNYSIEIEATCNDSIHEFVFASHYAADKQFEDAQATLRKIALNINRLQQLFSILNSLPVSMR